MLLTSIIHRTKVFARMTCTEREREKNLQKYYGRDWTTRRKYLSSRLMILYFLTTISQLQLIEYVK